MVITMINSSSSISVEEVDIVRNIFLILDGLIVEVLVVLCSIASTIARDLFLIVPIMTIRSTSSWK